MLGADDLFFFFFQAEDGIRDLIVTGVQTCALPICATSGPDSSRSFLPLRHLVAPHAATAEAHLARQPRLARELGEELALVGNALPDLRQESGAPAVALEDDAVLALADLREEIGLVAEAHRLRRGKERHLDANCRPLGSGERRKARIAERSGVRVLRRIVPQRTRGLEAADAAAQRAVLGQRDERRA